MKAIILAFTLKGQDFEKIKTGVSNVRHLVGEDTILIHGHLPRAIAQKKGFPTDLSDMLDSAFPVQLIMYNKITLREEMAEVGKDFNATVYVIGEIKEGVEQEVELYKKKGLRIQHMPFN